jgi:hypothetical protein
MSGCTLCYSKRPFKRGTSLPSISPDTLWRGLQQLPAGISRQGPLQYIAIGVANGGAQATGFAPLVPEIQNLDRAAAVWVFQLP